MSSDKLTTLATSLLARTKSGYVPWSETAHEAHFILSFTDSSVSIARRPWEHPSDWIYVLSVHNNLGTEIDSLRGNPGEAAHETLENLYEEARRSALKPDKVVDNILLRLTTDF